MRKRFWFLMLLPLLVLLSGQAGAASSRIDVLEVNGPIVPVVADYIQRGLSQAQSGGASLVVIQLDTEGGLVSSTQEIIEDILASPIPVVVYVSPAGGWAGSAGAFITLAGHVAAMAPGTFIGAAHPVSLTPGQAGELPSTQEEKMVNALVSSIRSIAQERGRNVVLAEDMVRKSVAVSDVDALKEGLIDLRADSLQDLLWKLETEVKEAKLLGGKVVPLRTQGVPVNPIPMNSVERFLFTISNPNIAYILLSLSMLAIFVEITNPGTIFPGVLGGLGLFLALYSLGVLGAYWAGLILMALAFALLVAEVFVVSHGILAAGGLTSLIIGSFLLFSGSPAFRIEPGLIIGMALGLAAFFGFALSAVIRSHRQPQPTGREGMLGARGIAKTTLRPRGTVLVQGELWEGIAEEGEIRSGEEVIVKQVDGLRLKVIKKKEVTR